MLSLVGNVNLVERRSHDWRCCIENTVSWRIIIDRKRFDDVQTCFSGNLVYSGHTESRNWVGSFGVQISEILALDPYNILSEALSVVYLKLKTTKQNGQTLRYKYAIS